MSYEILDDLTCADIAIKVTAKDITGLFFSGAEALLSVLIDNPGSIAFKTEKQIALKNAEIDLLLYGFLNEIIFFKDAESLLLLPKTVNIIYTGNEYAVDCLFHGEHIDRLRHNFNVDVKAVTMHNLKVENIDDGWIAVFILDV
ncbi:MAG: archease [Spirochaetota bacterium]